MRKQPLLVAWTLISCAVVTGCVPWYQNAQPIFSIEETKTPFRLSARYDGMIGIDWLDEQTIVIEEQSKLQPNHSTIYTFSLSARKRQTLVNLTEFPSNAIVSSEKNHMYYSQINDGDSEDKRKSTILILRHRAKVDVSDKALYPRTSVWLNDREMIASTDKGYIYLVDVTGQIIELGKVRGGRINDATIVGKQVYFVQEDTMYSLDVDTLQQKKILQKVRDLVLSPDLEHFALVMDTTSSKQSLDVVDLDGKRHSHLAEGERISDISWNHNQRMLAYVVHSNVREQSGLFVIDLQTRRINRVMSEIPVLSRPIAWSPSGRKLMVSTKEMRASKLVEVTTIFSHVT